MNQQHCIEFMTYLESVRTSNNSALIDAIQHGFALTEGEKLDAFKDKMKNWGSNALTLATAAGAAAGIGGAGYAAVKGWHGDDAERMERRVDVDKSLQKRGWTELPASWDDAEVNGRSAEWYQNAVDGLGDPHLTMSPSGHCTYNVLNGETNKLNIPGDLDGKKFPISVADAYDKSVCP